jgi:hypothetical protein
VHATNGRFSADLDAAHVKLDQQRKAVQATEHSIADLTRKLEQPHKTSGE